MTVEEVQRRVDLLNEMVDIEIIPMLKDRTDGICEFTTDTKELKKKHSAFMKGREQLFAELHLLGHDVITVPLMVSSSVWGDCGVKRVDGANYVDVVGVGGKQWKHWWGESENGQVHIYERIGPNFKPPRESNRFFTLLIFSERWDAKNGSLEDLYQALESLAVRFCIIDSELARRLHSGTEKTGKTEEQVNPYEALGQIRDIVARTIAPDNKTDARLDEIGQIADRAFRALSSSRSDVAEAGGRSKERGGKR